MNVVSKRTLLMMDTMLVLYMLSGIGKVVWYDHAHNKCNTCNFEAHLIKQSIKRCEKHFRTSDYAPSQAAADVHVFGIVYFQAPRRAWDLTDLLYLTEQTSL